MLFKGDEIIMRLDTVEDIKNPELLKKMANYKDEGKSKK